MVPESILRMPALRAWPFPILKDQFKMQCDLFAPAKLCTKFKRLSQGKASALQFLIFLLQMPGSQTHIFNCSSRQNSNFPPKLP